MTQRRPRLTQDDRSAWERFAAGVRPLSAGANGGATPEVRGASLIATAPGASRRPQPAPRTASFRSRAAEELSIGLPPPGLDRATWERFRVGRLTPARTLDLHGMTVQSAFQALCAFLRAAQADHVRCVEVVTGRGGDDGTGVLRRELPHWLNRSDLRPIVLGAAYPHRANEGAVRLLLRRIR